MRETRDIMGMPITVEVLNTDINDQNKNGLERIFDYFSYVDDKFSPFKTHSELMTINRGELLLRDASADMKEIFRLAEKTKNETDGFFDIVNRKGIFDPSGIVKGWSIRNASNILKSLGLNNHYVDAGGDIQVSGVNASNEPWSIGIKNPFNKNEIVKVIFPIDHGVATSGTYIRGQHIYNPKNRDEKITDVISLTVIGPDVYEADRFATAAFAMGISGIQFIEHLNDFEGYIINTEGIGTMTTGFEKFTKIT